MLERLLQSAENQVNIELQRSLRDVHDHALRITNRVFTFRSLLEAPTVNATSVANDAIWDRTGRGGTANHESPNGAPVEGWGSRETTDAPTKKVARLRALTKRLTRSPRQEPPAQNNIDGSPRNPRSRSNANDTPSLAKASPIFESPPTSWSPSSAAKSPRPRPYAGLTSDSRRKRSFPED